MISGKPKEQCQAALRAAFGNPDRAFEYLMSGVPMGGQGEGGAGVGGEEGDDGYGEEEESDPTGGNAF